MSRDMGLESGKGVVCPGLDEINKIIRVSPEVWSETCHRQGSWYRESGKAGQYLIISSFELHGFEQFKEATISRSDFLLPRPATREEKEEMVEDKESSRRSGMSYRILRRGPGSDGQGGVVQSSTGIPSFSPIPQTMRILLSLDSLSSRRAKQSPIRLTGVQTSVPVVSSSSR